MRVEKLKKLCARGDLILATPLTAFETAQRQSRKRTANLESQIIHHQVVGDTRIQ